MRQTTLPLPEVGLIAATRGMLGAGAAFLMADKVPVKRRKTLGWLLFVAGAVSTVPLMLDVVRHSRSEEPLENTHSTQDE